MTIPKLGAIKGHNMVTGTLNNVNPIKAAVANVRQTMANELSGMLDHESAVAASFHGIS